jgi:multiple sugar transport system substrate-binding protein
VDIVRVGRLVTALLLACLVCFLGGACGSDENDGVGPITFSSIADLTNGHQVEKAVDRWNREHPEQWVRHIEQSQSADEQRAQLVATAQGTGECYDVHSLDVVWTAEFARGHYTVPLGERESRRFGIRKEPFLPTAWESGRYRGKQWAVPFLVNAPLLYYRTDILDKEKLPPPTSLDEMKSQILSINQRRTAAGKEPIGGFGGQFARYEGLTVNALEVIRSRGGDLASQPDRAIWHPADVRAALDLLDAGVKSGGWIQPDALSYREEGTREAFMNGQLLFMRNWPYAYKLLTAAGSPVAGKVDVVSLPWSGVLGGHNLVVSPCSKRRATAWSFISFLTTNQDVQSTIFREGGYPAVLTAVYEGGGDSFTRAVEESLQNAGSRPVSPYYAAVSGTIQDAVSSVLTNEPTHKRNPDQAMRFLEDKLPGVLHGG